MSGSETREGLSLWPKLVLWGAVIVAGLLYLGSVADRRSGERGGQHVAGSVGEISPDEGVTAVSARTADVEATPTARPADERDAASGAAPRADGVPPEALVSRPVEVVEPATETGDTAEPTSPAAAEPAQDEGAFLTEQASASSGGTQDAAPEPGPAAGPPPAEAAQNLTEQVAVEESPRGGAAAEQAPEITAAEAEAFAKAVISGTSDGESGRATDPVSAATPNRIAPAAGVAAAPVEQVQDSPAERRARIMAEYEAMRQSAQEEMRRRWRQAPAPGRYGAYPGYPRAYYPPAYYPQRQR